MTNWDQRYCPTCGTGQGVDARFCGTCGTSFEPGPGPAGPDETTDGREVRKGGTPLVVFACLLVVAVTAASFTLLSEDDESDARPVEVGAGADGILLEPIGARQDDDFFADLDRAAGDHDDADAEDDAGDEDDGPSLAEIGNRVTTLPPFADARDEVVTLAGRQASGTTPGLYSGHRRRAVCDLDALSGLLTAEENAGPAAAWAAALGLDSPDDIDDLIDDLTPVRLRLDTRVTGHGYRDDEPVPYQSLLQAGTGVLVDDTGTPVVKCDSGGPLGPAAPPNDDISPETAFDIERWAANPADAWERLDPAEAVTVTPGSEPVDKLLLVDIDTTQPLERPIGTNGGRDLGTGDFEATLRWESSADLDLGVLDPNEASITTESPSPENSRGRHQGDANELCVDNMTGEERITWPDGDAPAGEYTVTVKGHAVGDAYEPDCGSEPVEFTLTIRLFGQDTIVHTGSVDDQEREDLTVTLGAGDGDTGDPDAADPDPEPGNADEA